MTQRAELVSRLYGNRTLAHTVLFQHRHREKSPPFHREIIEDFHGPAKGVVDIVFRGGAKSTIAEEGITLKGAFREYRNCLVIGENYDRAASRLAAIRRELEMNELLLQAFGELRGDTWGEDRLVLTSGVCIQCLGKGQSLRGIKHLDQRPDFVFGDDLENRQDAITPEARAKVSDWWNFDLMPAMDPLGKWRMAATTLHPEALPETLARSDPPVFVDGRMVEDGVIVHRYPWYYLNEEGVKTAAWPERFPMKLIEASEAQYIAQGKLQGYRQEFMCQAEAPELKPFKQDMMRVEPRVKTWQAVYSMTDPARTRNKNSADTGHAVWSWIGPKLVIWDAWGRQLLPNEIVDALFDTWDTYHPARIGIERDGLEEFLMQPIRAEQVKRGIMLPIDDQKAPVGKVDFIKGLQPFFNAREVEFVKPLPELQAQLLGFPTGKIDIPNALAYALKMRPGAPMYDDFTGRNIQEDLRPMPGRAAWLALNATHKSVTGILLQVIEGSIRVYADYVREGEPALLVADIIQAARLDAGANVKLTAGPLHFDQYNNVGLRQAIAKLPMEVRPGVTPERARTYLRGLLQREKQSMPMFLVSGEARWTLNGLAGGYSRVLLKGGILADYAEEGVYRTLIEGLESFLGLLELGRSTDDDDAGRFNAVMPDGRRYMSALAGAKRR